MPTTLGLNMQELQNWQHTKQASAKPMAQRVMMNVAESVTIDMANTARKQASRRDSKLLGIYHMARDQAASATSKITADLRTDVSWLTGC